MIYLNSDAVRSAKQTVRLVFFILVASGLLGSGYLGLFFHDAAWGAQRNGQAKSTSSAHQKSVKAKPQTRRSAPPKAGRSNTLSFEDDLVEGMNRNPFDSLTSIRSEDMRETTKLYRVKNKFTWEVKRTAQEAAYSQ